jgi:hypothetical protein
MKNEQAMEMLFLKEDHLRDRASFLVNYSKSIENESNIHSWEKVCASGTALLHAAQAAWFFDEDYSSELLYKSAQKYLHVKVPYGLFLLSLVSKKAEFDEVSEMSWVLSSLNRIAGVDKKVTEKEYYEELNSYALEFPSQQMYLIMGLLGSYKFSQKYFEQFDIIMEGLQSHENQPIGPHSVSLAEYLKVIKLSQQLHRSHGDMSLDRIIQGISPIFNIGNRYAISIERGIASKYLWMNMHSPVELIDFEVAGLVLRIAESIGPKKILSLMHDNFKLKGKLGMPFMINESLMKWRGMSDKSSYNNR